MEIKTVGIACDHAGYALKKFAVEYFESHNIPFKDYGTYSDLSCDYPDFAHELGEAISTVTFILASASAVAVKVWQ